MKNVALTTPFFSIASARPFVRIRLGRPLWRRAFPLLAFTFVCGPFAHSPTARAVSPPPDGGYLNNNTAEGDDALFSLTVGANNTAIGFDALYSDQNGTNNTAVGYSALFSNIGGYDNTAVGFLALESGDGGIENTAVGALTLNNNTGSYNTALGSSALFNNSGSLNTAVGFDALSANSGNENTAVGDRALYQNDTGGYNAATGYLALYSNRGGSNNTANGYGALSSNTTGSNNIGLGESAGTNLTTGSNNIDIGNRGAAGESNTIRIGRKNIHKNAYIWGISGVTVSGGVGVIIDTTGHLGTVVSSKRFKDEIRPMDKASEAILALKPVSFRYKHELDPNGIPQFGLVAEDVEKVNSDLVARDDQGKAYTVRYEAVNAMLLNEFLKEHRRVEEQEHRIAAQDRKAKDQQRAITNLEATVAQQQTINAEQRYQIQIITAGLRNQASEILKVNNQLRASKPTSQLVVTNE